jgi:hypothetical protein
MRIINPPERLTVPWRLAARHPSNLYDDLTIGARGRAQNLRHDRRRARTEPVTTVRRRQPVRSVEAPHPPQFGRRSRGLSVAGHYLFGMIC